MNRDSKFKSVQLINSKIKEIVDKVKSDLVIADALYLFPSAIKNNLWINLIATNPSTYLFDERAPPPCLGINDN